MSTLPDRLRAGIELLGLDLVQASQRSGVPYRSLHNYLSGSRDPKAEALHKISARLGISVDWLLTGEGAPLRAAEGPGEGGAEGDAPKSDNLTGLGEGLTPREVAVLTLYRALDEDAQREIRTVAEEKKRLRDIERQLQEVRAELAAAKQRP